MRKRNSFIILSLLILIVSFIFTLKIDITFRKFVDSYFIISGLITSLFLFKLIFDKGGFDVFRYSWHKTKRYILFFLPKYWNKDSDDEIQSFDDFQNYRIEKAWDNLDILLVTSLIHLFLSIVLSLVIYFL